MDPLDISIIIINWKSRAFVRQCLASIYANADGITFEILVVDNASYDGCEQMLKSEFPQVIFIQSEQNLGFAGANNLALGLSTGRNVLFLNPDTEILGSAIQKLVSRLESVLNAGMVGARLLNSDCSLQTTCITAVPSILNQTLNSEYLRRTFPKWNIWGMRALYKEGNDLSQVEAISGACMLAKREVAERVGGFTTDYFMYAEDMDLCVKIAEAGWKIFYVPDAMIVHHAAGSSSSRKESNFSDIMLRESLVRFLAIHRGSLYVTLYRCSIILISVLRIIVLLIVLPIAIDPRGYRFLVHALRKWCGILFWSLGLTRWASPKSRPRPRFVASKFDELPEL
jgi:N-acetylglucosaminyl-diphospho-decaprenol L-rhamnosyltransferase